MRKFVPHNDQWVFREGFDIGDTTRPLEGDAVRLPHTAVELPLNYFDETRYQRIFAYQTVIDWREDFAGRTVSLVFDAAMADATVFCNGVELLNHRDGYTPFEAMLSAHLKPGRNLVTVRIDGSENPEIPPFGGQIDYLTYAGIYRDVWLKVTDPVSIERVKIETPDVLAERKRAVMRCSLRGAENAGPVSVSAILLDPAGQEIACADGMAVSGACELHLNDLGGITLWDLDSPVLYTMVIEIHAEGSSDSLETRFGFRSAEFSVEGFKLNGRLVKLCGLNRHQAYPYLGYAMGRRGQERDAEILKHDLRCNVVRTSHYPQSPWFFDHCDRIGLLVFEEIPGWQHIGGGEWQQESIRNVRRMIERDWNHPSIIIWGVRINESQDNHDFYAETNRLARELDSTRATGGVRFITESELLEDVYTMNDFMLGREEMHGTNHGRIPLRLQQQVTGLSRPVPYMITEFNGHMHPTKREDPEQRQAEHVTRYLQVLNAAYGDPQIAGSIGWCMSDYNTHKDFGSGDRVCHHGVVDIFRMPKFAAAVYSSQGDPEGGVVLEPVTYWARGERNIGGVIPLIVLTNCDEIEMHYGGGKVKCIGPDRETYPHLPHPPVIIDHRVFSADELGRWGMKWQDTRLIGFVDGKSVTEVDLSAAPLPTTLEVKADHLTLLCSEKDAVRCTVRVLDQAGRLAPYLTEAVTVELTGPARLVGPCVLPLRGGATGFWVESLNETGSVTIKVCSARLGEVELALSAEIDLKERAATA